MEEFEAAKPSMETPYVVLETGTPKVIYSSGIPVITLPLGADGVENGYGWIDLGLPSGKKWAMCNVGATTPCEPGLLFQFGRVDGYAYGDTNHQFSSVNPPVTTSGKTYTAGDVLVAADDAAAVNMGGKWHMPTKADIDELIANTTNSWVKCNVEHDGEHTTMLGRLFVSKTDTNKKLFIPAAGYFVGGSFSYRGSSGFVRSSSVYSDNTRNAYYLDFGSRDCYVYSDYCYYGFSVRGVIDA